MTIVLMPAVRHCVLLCALVLALGGCSRLIDSDAARACRSLLPVLDRDLERAEIVDTSISGRTSFAEQAVAITYRATTGDGLWVEHRLVCLFDAPKPGVPQDPALGIAANLTAVVTDDGAIGPLRLHLLKQNWIARGAASAADPAPLATLGYRPPAPEVFVPGLVAKYGRMRTLAW